MPLGVGNYVKRQEQSHGAAFPASIDLVRRRQIGSSVRVKSTSEFRAPAQLQVLANPSPALTYVQPSKDYNQNEGGIFDGSVLDDSDDTTRDLDPVGNNGYQSMKASQDEWNFKGRNGVEKASQPGYSDD